MRILSVLTVTVVALFALSVIPTPAYSSDTGAGKLASAPYLDPKGYFKIIPPAGWKAKQYPDDPRGKVDFSYVFGPDRVQLIVIGARSPFPTFQALVEAEEAQSKRWASRRGGSVKGSRTTLFNVPTFKMIVERPPRLKVISFNFLMGDNRYHLALGGFLHSVDKFLPLAMKSIQTFQPMFPGGAPEDARKQLVVSKIKTAKFIIKSGNKDYALEIINEGLMLDPGNKELLDLKRKLVGGETNLGRREKRPHKAKPSPPQIREETKSGY